VQRVEVSLDDGERWADATLEPAINPPFTWVRWVFPFEAVAGRQRLRVRVTDGEGTVATEERRPPLPDGATGWPERAFEVEG
jgi:sulfite oxidase